MRTNRQRVADATIALDCYTAQCDDTRDAVVDLLTDLRHLCKAEAIDIDRAWAMSQDHYKAELLEDAT